MKKIKQFWIKLFMFCLIIGMISCAVMISQLNAEPNGESSKEENIRSQPGAPYPLTSQLTPSTPPRPTIPPSQPPTPAAPPRPTLPPSQATPPAPPQPSPAIAPATPPSPTPPPSPPSVRPPTPKPGQGVVFNFDNADLYEVIRVMGEILRINYIIDPRVKGVVNIHTSGQIPPEEAFPVFQSILKMNGATAVKKGDLYEIIPFSDGKKSPLLPSTTGDLGKLPSEDKYTIQIISVRYIPVADVSKLIKPFLSDGADIIEHPPNNLLIIGDVASNVKKSLEIIGLFDVDIFSDLRVRIYPILHSDVNEVAKEMEKIFSSFEASTKSGRGVGITFTPVSRINSLVVVSSIPNIFEKVEGWLKQLDRVPTEGSKFSVFVYYVQNAKAKDLAEVLKLAFTAAKEKKSEFKEKTAEQPPGQRSVRPTPTPTTPQPAPAIEEGGAVPLGEISIVVDEANNALVIRAFPRDYRNILETIKKLDIYPKQVLIEVLLAEITLDDSNKFGIEWAKFISSGSTNAQEVILQSRPPTDPFSQALTAGANIRYSIVELGGRVSAAINAAAKTNRLNVISSPHILASNNKEAKIQFGKSQPILTNTYTTGYSTGTTTGVVEGTIEYKDIGVILTVTPRISDGGLVTLELQIEKSDVATTTLGSLKDVPVFDKKTAKTTLSVLQGQMVVIGGFIADTKTRNKSGVPFLHKIPILGALFGTQEYSDNKTEMILLMTPHVIVDHIQSRTVTDEFREKVEGLKIELEKKDKKK